MISMQSNDQYLRAFTELVIFAHSEINSHIIDVKPKSRYPTLTNHTNTENLENLKYKSDNLKTGQICKAYLSCSILK